MLCAFGTLSEQSSRHLRCHPPLHKEGRDTAKAEIAEQNLERSGNLKKIIAAALSVLVGAFGYTVVDKALEDRVATLESEVVELREEVSRNHQYTTFPYDGSKVFSTSEDIFFPTESHEILLGDYLTEVKGSIKKFLIREYPYDNFEYIPHQNYDPVSFVSRPIAGNTAYFATTTPNTPLAEYYVNIEDVSAQITDIHEENWVSRGYNSDYSTVTKTGSLTVTSITVSCNGYTDSALSGKRIILNLNLYEQYDFYPSKIISNTIKDDGTFEYKAIYSGNFNLNSLPYFYINNLKINNN